MTISFLGLNIDVIGIVELKCKSSRLGKLTLSFRSLLYDEIKRNICNSNSLYRE